MEKDDEVKGSGNSYDFGARIYDSRLGRWMSLDPYEKGYHSVAPYIFALNTPIGAIDVDGNVVIFINGNHYGDGGNATYWRQYKDVQTGTKTVYNRNGIAEQVPVYTKVETYAFDKEVMNAFNDQKAIYKDGAIGGYAPFNGVSASSRHGAGYRQAKLDAQGIIDNLEVGETIKIVSHSMGGAYSKGYVDGLQEYMRLNKIEGVDIEIEVDFAPFQPDSYYNHADQVVPTYQASHTEDIVAGNEEITGAEQVDTSNDSNQGHSIFSFKETVKSIGKLLDKARNK